MPHRWLGSAFHKSYGTAFLNSIAITVKLLTSETLGAASATSWQLCLSASPSLLPSPIPRTSPRGRP
jgi:uncharacterized protein (DUF39 family)